MKKKITIAKVIFYKKIFLNLSQNNFHTLAINGFIGLL